MGQLRSIPACAGEPSVTVSVITHIWVYPRVCGGTNNAPCNLHGHDGLSPRVRGNLLEGEHEETRGPVYPRVCGGTLKAGPACF